MNKKYWLRGGIAGSIIGLLLMIVLALTSMDDTTVPVYSTGFEGFIKEALPAVLSCFVYGAVAGLIYGKIKNRNKSI